MFKKKLKKLAWKTFHKQFPTKSVEYTIINEKLINQHISEKK